MKNIKTFLAGILILIISYSAHAQVSADVDPEAPPPEPVIIMIAKTYGDSIRLRWAPETPATWLMLNNTGYRITRICYDHPTDTLKKELLPKPLKPLSLEEMKQRFGPSDTLAAIAAQMLYGQHFDDLLPEKEHAEMGDMVSELQRTSEIQQIRFAMALQAADFSFRVAEAIGLGFTDTDVEPGMDYVYGIEPVLLPGMSRVGSIHRVVFNDTLPIPETAPVKPGLMQKNDLISIAWPRDFNTAFYIEKSRNGGRSFTPVNTSPFSASVPDPNEIRVTSYEAMKHFELLKTHHVYNDKAYEGETVVYRLRGITPFGDLTPWSDTAGITVSATTMVKSASIKLTETIDNKMIRLSWDYDGDSSLLAGFIVFVSPSARVEFVPLHEDLLPPNQTWYTDSLASRRSFNYYRVMSVGVDGSQAESFAALGVLNDVTPPPPPIGLKGEIYTDGTLEVSWDPSVASDIRGYKVLHANHPDHNFIPYSGYALPPTLYLTKIPLTTLTRNLYIKVIAQDMAGNVSEPSELLVLERPDIIPPPKPLLLNSSFMEGTAKINWSLSYDPEVTGYYVWRQAEGVDQWDLVVYLDTSEVKESIWVEDKLPSTGQNYLYSIEAMDKSGNSSGLAKPVSFKSPRNRTESIPIQLLATYSPDNMACKLTWNCNPEGNHHFVIQRGIGDQEPADYRSASEGIRDFTDNRISPGMTVTYAIYIVFKDGRTSVPSDRVKVIIP